MGFIIGFAVFIAFLIVSIILSIISSKRYVDLFYENSIEKLKIYNYKSIEIKRKRRPFSRTGFPFHYRECSLEAEIPIPWSVFPPEDVIEVYGIKNNNKYLIYKMYWSQENVKKLKDIVDKLNKENEI